MKTMSFVAGIALLLALPAAALAGNGSHATRLAGTVTASSSSSIAIETFSGSTVTLGIDSSTKIVYGRGKSSIQTGDLVGVAAAGSTAKRIRVACNCHFAAGTIDAVSSSQLHVQVARTGPHDTVLKGQDVTFQIGSASLPNLSVGDKVGIGFSANGFFKDPNFNWQTATFTILKLRVAKAGS